MSRRLLFNFAAILSAVLSLAAVAMRVRSGYVVDSWELPPRSAPNFGAALQTGWVTHRHIESAAGRLVWINYDVIESMPTRPAFYRTPNEPLAPGQRSWNGSVIPGYPGTQHARIPGVVEWYATQRGGLYVAVPWLTLALVGALLPLARWLWTKRRAKATPAFPILPAREN